MAPRRRRSKDYPLTACERKELFERYRAGENPTQIARAMGCARNTVYNVFGTRLLSSARRVRRSERHLSLEEREQISRGLVAHQRFRASARGLDRAPSTISREVGGGAGRAAYRAARAERRALERSARPKPTKLSRCPQLVGAVEAGLARRWSPRQISARLRAEHPHEAHMQISHETIYRSLYIQSRGELRRQLAANLRSARTRRRPRGGGPERRGKIADMVPISERPPAVKDRAVPGHWEGDLLVGKQGRSFIATLVERHTRYVMLARLGSERSTEFVIAALKQRIRELPRHLVLSLTWDQGNELAAHARFRADTGIEVYFCDPHSPWQRGSNENTNGLLRQYLPKGSDLAAHSQVELDQIAAELNGRPRQTLGWATPAEKMEELLR
jgi:IS30 family transposase